MPYKSKIGLKILKVVRMILEVSALLLLVIIAIELEPVMECYVFKDLKNLDYAVLAANLWQQHFTMFELNEIMHQRESKFFAELLKSRCLELWRIGRQS